jgi:hypothetical protein
MFSFHLHFFLGKSFVLDLIILVLLERTNHLRQRTFCLSRTSPSATRGLHLFTQGLGAPSFNDSTNFCDTGRIALVAFLRLKYAASNPLADVMGHAKEKGRDSGRRARCPFIECIQWRDSCCTMVLTGRKPRYDLARMEARATD